MNMPHDVQQVLLGSLLGDGCVCIPQNRRNAIFAERHSLRQSNYLKWKAEILSKFFGGWVYPNYNRMAFHTRASPLLTKFRNKWYPNEKKEIPLEDLEKLDSLGLAVWYMDDGCYSYRDRSCFFSISCFKGQEFRIKEWFIRMWGLNPHISSGKNLRLVLSVKESDKFLHLIAQHIHSSLIYKLGHLHPSNLEKIREKREKNIEKNKRYRQENQDKVLAYRRRYRERNRQYQREYYRRRGKFLRALRRAKNRRILYGDGVEDMSLGEFVEKYG